MHSCGNTAIEGLQLAQLLSQLGAFFFLTCAAVVPRRWGSAGEVLGLARAAGAAACTFSIRTVDSTFSFRHSTNSSWSQTISVDALRIVTVLRAECLSRPTVARAHAPGQTFAPSFCTSVCCPTIPRVCTRACIAGRPTAAAAAAGPPTC